MSKKKSTTRKSSYFEGINIEELFNMLFTIDNNNEDVDNEEDEYDENEHDNVYRDVYKDVYYVFRNVDNKLSRIEHKLSDIDQTLSLLKTYMEDDSTLMEVLNDTVRSTIKKSIRTAFKELSSNYNKKCELDEDDNIPINFDDDDIPIRFDHVKRTDPEED